jgi:hypothetical protein
MTTEELREQAANLLSTIHALLAAGLDARTYSTAFHYIDALLDQADDENDETT